MHNHKTILSCVAVGLLFLLLSGCGRKNDAVSGTAQSTDSETEEVTLEDWQKDLLSSVYTTEVDRRHIASGDLYSHHKETLKKLSGLLNYLTNKYPGYAFTIESLELPNPFQSFTWYVCSAEGFAERFDATLTPEKDYRDNFYAILKRGSCEQLLMQELSARGIRAAAVSISFTAVTGSEVSGNADAATVLQSAAFPKDTGIYVCGDSIDAVKQALADTGYIGAVSVYSAPAFAECADADACHSWWMANRDQAKYSSFRLDD